MEGNPDYRSIADRLRDASYPPDPAAWEQMEQLLDGKKKRRGIFWWSMLGITTSLLLGAGVYIGMNHTVSGKTNAIATLTDSARPDRHEATTFSTATEHSANNTQAASADLASGTISPDASTTASQTTSNHESPTHTKPTEHTEQSTATASTTSITTRKTHDHSHHTSTTRAKTTNQTSYSLAHAAAAISYPQTAAMEQSMTRPVINIEELKTAPILLNSVSYTCLYDDKEEPEAVISSSHRKKPLIHYQIGIENGVYESFARKTFADKPTWMTGLSQELLIGKYFAITNSILYSELNFKIDNPEHPVNYYSKPESYRSHTEEIAVPIGVKLYAYSSPLIKISVGVSYVNHIKLKETFDYKINRPASSGSYSDQGFYPSGNDFSGQPNNNLTSVSLPPNQGSPIAYYSIGNARRYYGSLRYTAGVDFLLPKHFSIAAEPAFMMSLDKIKLQNTRVFDFGLNTGVKYTF